MQVAIVLDTETTGFDPETNSLVEIASVWRDGEGVFDYFHTLIKPTTKISFGAMAAHHITEEMAAEGWDADTAVDAAIGGPESDVVMVAHNAEFDKSFLPPYARDRKWVCTYRCAMHLWPNAESHSNQSLRYEMGVRVDDLPLEAGAMAHRALYDAWVTNKLFEKMLEERSIEELVLLTNSPIIRRKVGFGKHFGELWEEVPQSYLRWVLSQDFDADTIHTCNFHLGRL